MMRTTVFAALLCCLFSMLATAQQNKPERKFYTVSSGPKKAQGWVDDARELIGKKKFDEGLKKLEKALTAEPKLIDVQFMYAEAWMNNKKDTARAKEEYEKTIALDSVFRAKALFQLAMIAEKEKDYKGALFLFDRFTASKKNTELLDRMATHVANCRFMVDASAPVPFKPINLGDNINTAADEYLPSLSLDGQTLIYTVKDKDGGEDFYTARREGNAWGKGVPLGPPINTAGNEGAQTLSANGKTLIYTVCNRPGDFGLCDLYISEYKSGKWSTPRNMGAPINTSGWEAQPSLSADGNILYFVGEKRPNSSAAPGGRDIWVSKRYDGKNWSEPTVLSSVINTNKDEQSPFIHPDGVTLYFASDGLRGFGKSDLFFSRRDSAGIWSAPRNLGTPINTEKNEFSMIVSADGKTAIYAARNLDDSRGGTDLYTFDLYEAARPRNTTYVKANVVDATTGKPLQGVPVVLKDIAKRQTAASVVTDENGEFIIALPTGRSYGLNVSARGYLFYSDNFTPPATFDKFYDLNIKLQGVSNAGDLAAAANSGKAIVLRNIFFATGSAELQPESLDELSRLLALLKENPTMRIRIGGHTDNTGSASTNATLSQKRAESVSKYLLENGIVSARLEARGYGDSQPVDSNGTEEGRSRNRRTEFTVIR